MMTDATRGEVLQRVLQCAAHRLFRGMASVTRHGDGVCVVRERVARYDPRDAAMTFQWTEKCCSMHSEGALGGNVAEWCAYYRTEEDEKARRAAGLHALAPFACRVENEAELVSFFMPLARECLVCCLRGTYLRATLQGRADDGTVMEMYVEHAEGVLGVAMQGNHRFPPGLFDAWRERVRGLGRRGNEVVHKPVEGQRGVIWLPFRGYDQIVASCEAVDAALRGAEAGATG